MNIQHSAARQLNEMKKTLQSRFNNRLKQVLPLALISRALDEAEEAAHESGFALLVFPVLAEEMIERVVMVVGADTLSAHPLALAAA